MDGDVTIGDHRLCLGDCFDVLPTLPAQSVDLVFADLPYGVTRNTWDTAPSLLILWQHLLRVGKHNCAYAFTATMRFAAALVQSNPKMFRYDLVIQKPNPTNGSWAKTQPLRYHELMLLFYKKQPRYMPQMRPRESLRQGIKLSNREYISRLTGGQKKASPYNFDKPIYPSSILTGMAQSKCKAIHPTQKSVALLEWLSRTYTAAGDTILDPTSGVATVSVAAHRTGRRSICIERDPEFYAKGVARVRDEVAGVGPVVKPKPKRAPKPVPAAQGALW